MSLPLSGSKRAKLHESLDEAENTLAASLSRVLEQPRSVSVCVCGQTFDFDVLRVAHVYPNNIFVPLATTTAQTQRGEQVAGPRPPCITLEIDLLAMRTIYAFYAYDAIVTPASQEARDILALTCDYTGCQELIARIQAACETMQEEPIAVQQEESRAPQTAVAGDSEFVELPRPDASISEHCAADPLARLLRVREPGDFTPEDAKIMMDETSLRRQFLELEMSPEAKSLVVDESCLLDFLSLHSTPLLEDPACPYTLAKSEQALPTQWVTSMEEFRLNLFGLSFGVFDDPETLPPGVAIAGGSVLRCLGKAPVPPGPAVMKTLKWWMHAENADPAITSPPVLLRSFAALEGLGSTSYRTNQEPVAVSEDLDSSFRSLITMHLPTVLKFLRRRGRAVLRRSMGGLDSADHLTSQQEILEGFRKTLPGSCFVTDIDLFFVTTDPVQMVRAMETVYHRFNELHGPLCVVRTEHAVTFVARSRLVPKIQFVLRSYVGGVLQVLTGFDIDACCLAYDGRAIFCTRRSVRALRRGYNLVDTSRLSTTYEVRLLKYMNRGFSIAMTHPAVATHIRELIPILLNHRQLSLWSTLIGVTRLAYLLVAKWKLLLPAFKNRKLLSGIMPSDYADDNLRFYFRGLLNGLSTTPYVLHQDLHAALFGRTSVLPQHIRSMMKRKDVLQMERAKGSSLGPLRVRVRGASDQGPLFTGSFQPLKIAWFEGGIRLPDEIARLSRRRTLSVSPEPTELGPPLPQPGSRSLSFEDTLPQELPQELPL